MAATVNADARIEEMVARILAEARTKEAHKIDAWKKPTDDIKRLVRHDYVRSLRRNLPYRELKTMMAAFGELLPGFNREVVGMMPTDRLAGFATTLNLQLACLE